jgi:hypothetical protein
MYEELVQRYFFISNINKPKLGDDDINNTNVNEKISKEEKGKKEKENVPTWNYLYYEPDYLLTFVRMVFHCDL